MYIRKKSSEGYAAHGSLRDRLVRELKEEVLIIKEEISKEEVLRREMLEKIKNGELLVA
jgi:hypothetical protein